jgi:WD40 repeat protein
VKETLKGHKGRVNKCKWISEDTILSGSNDKMVFIWKKNKTSVKKNK